MEVLVEGLPEAEVLEEEEELVITGHRVHIQTKCHHEEELLEDLEEKLLCLGALVEENLEDSDEGPLEDSFLHLMAGVDLGTKEWVTNSNTPIQCQGQILH